MSSLAHDNMLDNLDFREPARERIMVLIKLSDSSEVSKGNYHLPEEEKETAAVHSFFRCETEENSTAVLDVSTEEFTQNLCASRDLEARMHTQTVLSMNDFNVKGNSQPEEDLLFEKDPLNSFKVITANTFPDSITHFLVSESGSLNSTAAEADFGCILPISCSSTSTYEDQDQKTSITDKAISKLGASSRGSWNLMNLVALWSHLLFLHQKAWRRSHLIFGDIDDCCDTEPRYTESTSSDHKEKEDFPPASSGSLDF
ncbi:hypothetical protein HAX54_015876 [Datura stramonium]|uniref:Uncharacterized protein n=1 Tax=Datura stramonium TaxID=4076 RepID=A0ABS8UHY2_DATST|nr:hypothetical protein [Datura stramonium]